MKAYEIITQKIIERLEKGDIPWHKPWSVQQGMPKNLITKKEYRGINVFLLASNHYPSPYWLTYKQAKDLGGNVRQGEKGTPVVFWKWLSITEKEDEKETEKQIPFLRYYTVFNVAQCDGFQDKVPGLKQSEFNPIERCEQIVNNYAGKPEIQPSDRAWYSPSLDKIGIPPASLFNNPEEYYSTLFHEMTHSTGHASRLDRSGIKDVSPFGSKSYSQEELVAEMGAAFLCGNAAIENKTIDNSAAYIQGWLRKLSNDKKCVIIAAAQAQKAADYILGETKGE